MHFWGYIRVQRAHIWAVCATWNLSFTASHRSQLKKNCYRVIKKDCNGVRLSVGFWDSVLEPERAALPDRGITMKQPLQNTIGAQLRAQAEAMGLPLTSIWKAQEGLAKARTAADKEALARLMLRHGRLTDEAREYVTREYPQS